MSDPIEALFTDDDVEVFERSYADRAGDLHRERRATVLRDCSNPACRARVAIGIPHCCQPCRDADPIGEFEHSAKCLHRQAERGVQL